MLSVGRGPHLYRLGETNLLRSPTPTLSEAIVATLTYSSLFDYALDAAQLHRFLVGHRASREEIEDLLPNCVHIARYMRENVCYITLRGREELFEQRLVADTVSAEHWSRCLYYGGFLRAYPSIRMALVTGSLAAGNSRIGADADLMCLVDDRRLWSTWLVIRWLTRLSGGFSEPEFCLNYIVGPQKRQFPPSIYIAWELAKAVPLFGGQHYFDILFQNRWVYDYLPNAEDLVSRDLNVEPVRDRRGQIAEWSARLLDTRIGGVVELVEELREKWVIKRKYGNSFAQKKAETEIKYHKISRNVALLTRYSEELKRVGLSHLGLWYDVNESIKSLQSQLSQGLK